MPSDCVQLGAVRKGHLQTGIGQEGVVQCRHFVERGSLDANIQTA